MTGAAVVELDYFSFWCLVAPEERVLVEDLWDSLGVRLKRGILFNLD